MNFKKLTQTTQHSYIVYQRNTYHNVPLWVLVNALTFGTLSKMYFFFPFDLQSKVSKNFPSVNAALEKTHICCTVAAVSDCREPLLPHFHVEGS